VFLGTASLLSAWFVSLRNFCCVCAADIGELATAAEVQDDIGHFPR